MSDEKTAAELERDLAVVQALYKRTREGKVDWQVSSAYGAAFRADFGGLLVVIRETPDEEYPDEPDYAVLVIQKPPTQVAGAFFVDPQEPLGRVVESISNTTLRSLSSQTTEEGLNPYKVLKETFKMARRKALKVDATLDELLQRLDQPE